MSSSILIGLGLASIVFFSVILITGALMMRNQWDDFARRRPPEPPDAPHRRRPGP